MRRIPTPNPAFGDKFWWLKHLFSTVPQPQSTQPPPFPQKHIQSKKKKAFIGTPDKVHDCLKNERYADQYPALIADYLFSESLNCWFLKVLEVYVIAMHAPVPHQSAISLRVIVYFCPREWLAMVEAKGVRQIGFDKSQRFIPHLIRLAGKAGDPARLA
jgi:hypothetical protein